MNFSLGFSLRIVGNSYPQRKWITMLTRLAVHWDYARHKRARVENLDLSRFLCTRFAYVFKYSKLLASVWYCVVYLHFF